MLSLPAAAAADKPRAPLRLYRGPDSWELGPDAPAAAATAPSNGTPPGTEEHLPGPFDGPPVWTDGGEEATDRASRLARDGVRDWVITAVGGKPEYHLARDCLHGSLHRNRLASWSRNYARQPPPWVTGLTAHLPAPERVQAVEHVALHFQHLRRLALLAEDEVGGVSL